MYISSRTQLKIERGFYMGGIVAPDQKKCECGGKFIKKLHRGAAYFACQSCDKDPKFFRVRRYLPGLDGDTGKTVEIRYFNKKRLTTIAAAQAAMESIDELVESGNFDPSDFLVKEADNLNLFRNFVAKKYLPHYEKRVSEGLTSPATLKAKKQYLDNHLMEFFGDKSLKAISTADVKSFYSESKASMRMRDLAAQELKALLNFAREELEVPIKDVIFPKIKKAKLKDAELFLTHEQQAEVIDRIDDERYKIMIQIMCHIAIRPSEVRALKWSDWDFGNKILTIRRHAVLGSKVLPGRKSNDDIHQIHISDELFRIIYNIPRPINQDEFMFKGDIGEIVSEHVLSRAWAKAIRLTDVPYIDLYRGSKSSRLSQMLRAGHSREEIGEVAGIGGEALKRYAQYNNGSRMETQAKLLKIKDA